MSGAAEHRVRTADGVEIALHRVPPYAPAGRSPVLLVPGTFSTRTLWIGRRGQGLAAELARHGFDCWVLELRGHGRSDRPRSWTMNHWIQLDAPAAAARVLEETGAGGLFWVGHSAGGVVGAAFGATGGSAARRLRGLVLVGSPGPGSMSPLRRALAGAGHWAARLAPRARLPGRLLGLGPEPEPAPLVRDWLGWNLRGTWRDPRGGDYLAALGAVTAPVLGIAGAGDRLLAPPAAVRDLVDRFGAADREVLVAGLRTGFRRDYDHAGLLIGRDARDEVWPRIVGWLLERTRRCESTTLPIGEA